MTVGFFQRHNFFIFKMKVMVSFKYFSYRMLEHCCVLFCWLFRMTTITCVTKYVFFLALNCGFLANDVKFQHALQTVLLLFF